jgi:serine/threonine protein kinase
MIDILIVAEQASGALAYLHSEKVVHRDIKPPNILVRCVDPLNIAVTDFGLAKADRSKMVSRKGTPFYAAPEILYGRSKYGSAVDIWSLGVVILQSCWEISCQNYERSLRHPSIDDYSQSLQLTDIVEARNEMLEEGAGPFMQLMGRMLELEPEKRPTARECYEATRRIREETLSTLRQHADVRRQQGPHSSWPPSGPSSKHIPSSSQRPPPKSHETAQQVMQRGAPKASGSEGLLKKLGFSSSSGDQQSWRSAPSGAQDPITKKRVNSVEASLAAPQARRRQVNR